MSLTVICFIGLLIFLGLMLLEMQIGLAMALAGFIGLWLIRGIEPAMSLTSIIAYSNATSYTMTILPLFVLMGLLAAYGGISKDAFKSMNTWVGHFRGGLAMAVVGACAAFGAVCGSNTATAATMVTAALPEMRKYGYHDELSLGAIASGGNLGFLIPPSGAFVVYGFVTQTSIGALFIAGILPGILCTILMCIAVLIVVSARPSQAPRGAKATWGERVKSLKGLWSIVFLFVLVIGGIYTGIFTPTEAAAIGAFVTLVLGLVTRQLTRKGLMQSLTGTVKTTAMIFLLVIGAMIFGTFLTASEVTIKLGQIIRDWQVNPYVVMAVILIFYIICGFFMDAFALLIVSLPIAFPIVVDILKFDPIAFGVLCVVTIMIGCITPPVGLVVFAVHGIVKDVEIWTIFRGCTPHVAAMCVLLVLLVAFPQISTILPSMMMPYK